MMHRRIIRQGPALCALLCALLFSSQSAPARAGDGSFVANASGIPTADLPEPTLDDKTVAPPPGAIVTAADVPQSDVSEGIISRPTGNSKQPAFGGLSTTRTIIALAVVLALIIGVSAVLRRFNPTARGFARGGCLQVLVRTSIGAKQSLCLVKLSDRLILLGVSPNHIAALDSIDEPEDVAHIIGLVESGKPNSITGVFRSTIDNEMEAYEGTDLSPHLKDDTSPKHRQYARAQGELATLLDKVKGLSRIRFRS